MEAIALLLVAGIVIALYFLPSLIAVQRQHHQTWPIVIINLFFGWTFIGWVIALAMSAGHVQKSPSA